MNSSEPDLAMVGQWNVGADLLSSSEDSIVYVNDIVGKLL